MRASLPLVLKLVRDLYPSLFPWVIPAVIVFKTILCLQNIPVKIYLFCKIDSSKTNGIVQLHVHSLTCEKIILIYIYLHHLSFKLLFF